MPQLVTVAKVDEIPAGTVKSVEANGKRIALCNYDGTFYAIDDVCTHDGGALDQGELFDFEIECPRHGARFDVRTCAVTCLPAVLPVKTYPLRVENGSIAVEVDEKR